jgi:hypothetical protein
MGEHMQVFLGGGHGMGFMAALPFGEFGRPVDRTWDADYKVGEFPSRAQSSEA